LYSTPPIRLPMPAGVQTLRAVRLSLICVHLHPCVVKYQDGLILWKSKS
jgi:hypothetical protein